MEAGRLFCNNWSISECERTIMKKSLCQGVSSLLTELCWEKAHTKSQHLISSLQLSGESQHLSALLVFGPELYGSDPLSLFSTVSLPQSAGRCFQYKSWNIPTRHFQPRTEQSGEHIDIGPTYLSQELVKTAMASENKITTRWTGSQKDVF